MPLNIKVLDSVKYLKRGRVAIFDRISQVHIRCYVFGSITLKWVSSFPFQVIEYEGERIYDRPG